MAKPHRKLPTLTQQQIERFHSHVDRRGPDECWPWIGSHSDKGYGRFSVRRLSLSAHRMAFMLATSTDPDNLQICHSCDNPPCCNPAHLFLGTQKDNLDDCREKGRLNKAKGEAVCGSLLTEEQVRNARLIYLTGRHTHQQIADQMGVTREAIGLVLRGKNWKHIPANASAARSIGQANKSRATAERNHRCAKLTDDDVREIKRLKAEGTMMQKDIALRFGVTPSHVSIIVNEKFKAHVTPYGSKA